MKKMIIPVLAATMFMFSCSSDDTNIDENDTVVSDGSSDDSIDAGDSGDTDDSGDSDGSGNNNETTVTNAKISLVLRDADRGTSSDGTVTYSISSNTYYFIIEGAEEDNTYQLKLTGKTLGEEYLVDLEIGDNGVPQYSLDPSNVAAAPDNYTAEIYEVETEVLIDLESFQFGSGANAVDQDYYFTINNSYNNGAITFTEATFEDNRYSYNDLTSITIDKTSTSRIDMRYVTAEVGSRIYMQIFSTDGTLVQDTIGTTSAISGFSSTEYFEFRQDLFTGLNTSGSYLFRLVNFNPFDNSISGYSELYEADVTLE